MRNRIFFAALAVTGIAGIGIALAQMGMGHGMGARMGGGMMGNARHAYYMHHGLPDAYAGQTNPLSDTQAVLSEGRKLYAENCAACHGAEGLGDGAAGAELNPKPADLIWTLSMPVARDDFLYWSISEGGAQFGSAMPAFKSTLKPNEIWAIITALRSGDLKGG